MISKFLKVDGPDSEISHNLLLSFFNNIPISIIIYRVENEGGSSFDYIIEGVNPKAIETEAWQDRDVIGKALGEVRPGVDDFGIINIFKAVWESGETFYYPAKIYKEADEYKWFENTIFKLPTGEIVAVYEDVTESKEKEERIKYLSYKDPLTDLYNRAYFHQIMKEYDNKDQLPLTIVMADLNGLKLINDVFGYKLGDKALIEIANVLRDRQGPKDLAFRYGGDEFVLILPNSSEQAGEAFCDQILEAASKLRIEDTKISMSIGYATRNNLSESWVDILKAAEDYMYRSKLLGEESYRSLILSSIKNTLFEKSNDTEEHSERLENYCVEIGRRLGLTMLELDELRLFTLLHDVGKIGIDSRILDKPGPLTDAEWRIMKTHPEIGYRIAKAVPELVNIADYILSHHERWDGKGYPRGLEGEDIPILSRILSLVDAYDAMTNNRSYRKALSHEVALEEIIKNSGTQFDPRLVDIFIEILKI